MEAELTLLEEKVTQLARLATDLRAENQQLRQRLLAEQQDNAKLKQKLDGAITRIAMIMAKMPEETE